MEESPSYCQISFHPTTPETFHAQYAEPFAHFASWQTAMTPYLVPTPLKGHVNPLPSPPLTPSPPDNSFQKFPGALPTYLMPPTPKWIPTGSPVACSEVGDNFSYCEIPTSGPDLPLLPLRMDAKFWESHSSYTGSREEAPHTEITRAAQFDFEYEEYSDEDSETYEMETSHSSEDDGYYGSGEDSSSVEEFEEAHTPPESLLNPWEGSLPTLTPSNHDSPSDLGSPLHSGFLRRPVAQQRQEYEQWLKSQTTASSSPDTPEIHSPIPRRLVQWDRFGL